MARRQVQHIGAVHQAGHEQHARALAAIVQQPAAALLPDRRRIGQVAAPGMPAIGGDAGNQRGVLAQRLLPAPRRGIAGAAGVVAPPGPGRRGSPPRSPRSSSASRASSSATRRVRRSISASRASGAAAAAAAPGAAAAPARRPLLMGLRLAGCGGPGPELGCGSRRAAWRAASPPAAPAHSASIACQVSCASRSTASAASSLCHSVIQSCASFRRSGPAAPRPGPGRRSCLIRPPRAARTIGAPGCCGTANRAAMRKGPSQLRHGRAC